MQVKLTMPSMSAVNEPRFDERYLADAFAALDTNVNGLAAPVRSSQDATHGDLEAHARAIARIKCLDECEDAVADLSPSVTEYLNGVFDQISDSFLPAPLWQAPGTPSKGKNGSLRYGEGSVVLRSLRIVSAARLALASDATARDRVLKGKIDRLYRAASKYLDSVPEHGSLEDIEALLLLAELEYGRNLYESAKTRLKNVIGALTESSRMRSTLIFGQSATLLRRRNALRTALMMLHWYFAEVPAPLEDLDVEVDLEPGETVASAEELFVTSQLRLASLHHRLKRFLDAQPYVDERVWQVCEKAFSMWYDELRDQSKSLDNLTEDAPVNFFVFHQQYLTTRIKLSQSHEKLYRRRSGMRSPSAQRESWTCPTSAKNDAIKLAASLRNYGQRHRFREAPLSFVNHISAAADIVLSATEVATNDDDRNAYLHISSFLCGVLKYMAEVHVRASTLLEAMQLRMNNLIQNPYPYARSGSTGGGPAWENRSAYSMKDSSDTHLWQWTRHDSMDEFGATLSASGPVERERPRSVVGVLQTAPMSTQRRPVVVRQKSTPARLPDHPEASVEDLHTATPSYYSVEDEASVTGWRDRREAS